MARPELLIKDYDFSQLEKIWLTASYIPLNDYPSGQHHLQILSIEGAIQNIATAPEGTLIVEVRQNKTDHPVWVSYRGI